jgi:pyruvate formate lyase activating enzyme
MDMGKEAMYYDTIEGNKVHCSLCPHNCVIRDGDLGACRARKNNAGSLCSLNYGKISSISLDPIEKKPLNRFRPGSLILSAGSFGCNMKCSFCQNWSIAHANPHMICTSPHSLADKVLETRSIGNIGLAYTYNEPAIWYEFVYETSKLVKGYGLVNVLVTNGFINEEPLINLLPFIDAMNIDVKAFTASFYKGICKASLDNVKKTVEIAAQKCHVEVTTLVIPDLNDDMEEIDRMARWLAGISPDIPLHLSRFFPNYKMTDRQPTPVATLARAKEKALEHLKYVYLGNV